MLRQRRAPAALLVVLAAGFAAGIALLFRLRFATGDIHPPYSTLRADPIGARALYEALRDLPGLDVGRVTRSIDALEGDPGTTTLFLLGVPPADLERGSAGMARAIASLASRGMRVVIALAPEETVPFFEPPAGTSTGPGATPGREPTPQPAGPATPLEPPPPAAMQRFGFAIQRVELPLDETGAPRAGQAMRAVECDLPATLPWHSRVVFRPLHDDWTVLYTRGDRPVLIERRFGRGAVVLSSDAYFSSNEGLREHPEAALLAWLVGSRRRIRFDETHLGVLETPGIATLMRRYRLHGLLAGALVLAGLFVWSAAARFGPPLPAIDADAVAGRDAASGFVTLLKRGIVPRHLLGTCVVEWKRTAARSRPELVPEVERLAAGAGDPVRGYVRICQLLSQTRGINGEHHER